MHPMVNIALRAARKAGDIIVRAGDRIDTVQVESKGVNDFVTEVDRAAEQEIISHLRKAYPTHAIRGEESGDLPGKDDGTDYQWIIDPLDGTTNFTRGIPHYAVSIGCFYKGRPEHAVIYDPVRQEEFTATRGAGAQINGRRMRVSSRASLDGALLATGIPFRARQQMHLDAYLNTLRSLSNGTAGIRRAGAASLDLAYVAAGRVDGFWEIGLSPWDIAAGALLVLEAGGLIGDFNGGNDYMTSGNVVCANPKCFKAMLQVIKPHLGHIS
jgi:myo-inositol-1(or 4)-monophosphatase